MPDQLVPFLEFQRASHPGSGPFRMMEELIQVSNTTFVMLQDSDDLALPDRIEKQLAALSDGELDAIGTAVVHFQGDTLTSVGVFPMNPRKALSEDFGHALLYPTLMMKSTALRDVGGYRHIEKFGIDTEFVNRLAAGVKVQKSSHTALS